MIDSTFSREDVFVLVDLADKEKKKREPKWDEMEGREGGERKETAGDWAWQFHSSLTGNVWLEFNTQLSPLWGCVSSADVIHVITEKLRIKLKCDTGRGQECVLLNMQSWWVNIPFLQRFTVRIFFYCKL